MEIISYENEHLDSMFVFEAKKLGIKLNNDIINKFNIYKELLVEWNKKINLTAITDDKEIIMKHFIDCLEVVKYIKNDSKVIDVGTGAGFPGIVIAIYMGDKVKVTLVDALLKRINFLEVVKDKLNLNNVKIIHARAEELAQNLDYREMYDYAVSRAVAPLNILLEYDVPYIKVGSKCLLLKGLNANDEITNSSNALINLNSKITNIYEYSYLVDEEKFDRKIVEVTKNKSTPNKYPRSYAKIKKNPL